MKKYLLRIITLYLCIVCLTCCSKEDQNAFIPKIPGDDLKDGELQIVFTATESNHILTFKLNSDYPGKFAVEWGNQLDPKSKQYSASDNVAYDFPVRAESYVVTISAPAIKSIELADESAPAIKGLYFGNCSSFEGFSMDGASNNLEVLDISRCPRLWGGRFVVFRNNPNFDLNGLKKAGYIELYTSVSAPIKLADAETEIFRLFPQTDYISSLEISSCHNLNGMEVTKGTNGSSFVRVENIDIKDTRLKEIHFYAISTRGLDLSHTGEMLEVAFLNFFDAQEPIKWNKSLKQISVNTVTGFDFSGYPSNISSLDFSGCSELEYLTIEFIEALKDIKLTGGLNKLKRLWIQGNSNLEELKVADMDSLISLNIFNHDKLKRTTITNTPLLTNLDIINSRELNSIQMDHLPFLSEVDLANDNLDGNQITDFFSKLDDQLDKYGNKRNIKIAGNPGDTESIRAIISKSGNWKIFDGEYPDREEKSETAIIQYDRKAADSPQSMSGTVRK